MQGYKLFRLVRLLQAEELPDVDRFLHTDYHNTHVPSRRLFRYLVRFWPDLDAPQLSREQLFRKVYGKEPYQDLRLRKLMSRLTGLLERYLVHRRMTDDRQEYRQQLAAALASRQDHGLFLSEVQDQLADLEQHPERGESYLSRTFQLYRQIYYHPQHKQHQQVQSYFWSFVQAFETQFVLQALTFGIENRLLSRHAAREDDQSLLPTILQFPDDHVLLRQPVVAFFLRMYRLLSESDRSPDIPDLRVLLETNIHRMNLQEKKMAYKVIINYMTPFSNSGNMDHSVFLFELYRGGIDLGLLDEGSSTVAANFFLNVVTIALTVDALGWTESFIRQYGHQLPAEDREATLLYSQAYWHYVQGVHNGSEHELSQARLLLQTIPIRSDELLNTRVRTLEIRVMYDQLLADELMLEDLLAAISNFRRHLVGRSNLTEANVRRYLNFIVHVRNLARLSEQAGTAPADLHQLLEEVRSDDNTFFRTWLTQKITAQLPDTGQGTSSSDPFSRRPRHPPR